MPTKSKQNKHKTATVAATAVEEHPMMNPVLKEQMVPIISGRLAESKIDLVQPVDGLTLARANDVSITFPQLAQFPLGYSPKTGRLSGKLMNIAQFCRAKTGRAWNAKHAATVKEQEGIVLHVLPDKTDADKALRKSISKELDEARPRYYVACKGITAQFLARNDSEVQSAQIRETNRGITLTTKAIIPTGKSSEAERLRMQLSRQEELIKQLESHIPAKTLKGIKQKVNRPVNVESIVEQASAATAEAVNRLTKANEGDKAGAVAEPQAETPKQPEAATVS